jgi:tetratricopeptide (TPR) repeat protein
MRTLAIVAACMLVTGVAAAQPAPQKPSGDVKSLMASGVKLFEAKDYLGALAVFKDAYARFPSAKILLNIGTTLTLLDRKAEAANAYQRYLDSPDADLQKKPEVANAIADLDKSLGKLTIAITPADAEVQVGEDEYVPAAKAKVWRVPAGEYRVRARKDRFQPEGKSAPISAGQTVAVAINLTAIPEETRTIIVPVDNGVRAGGEVAGERGPRSRIGALAMAHLDIPRQGGAAFLGVTADVIERLQVQAAAIVGPYYGGYAGAAYAIATGQFQPFVAAGMPIFSSSGARFGLRGAGGLEVQLNRHVALIAELGVEYMLNPEIDIKKVLFVPAVGASGRL